ncbi:cytoplasmic protein [Paenibacillus oryzae]|uniref:Cytoplasmic protein n=1 Tax=Paenibacillus oryzae TaxID=1844972 RepID=A0A1A5YG75_9BACL|nr:MOSC domain-containing protein [Paenibacillus oryzae]OBR64400.1 cytoplasmic protein [Paenibacillus oryzae]
MIEASVLSLNIGLPAQMPFKGKEVSTGIFKKPVQGPLFLSRLNFEGDGQADTVHHGGADKAVCVYPYEHYAYWERELDIKLEPGAFGENVTLDGLREDDVHIGDIFSLGEAVVQISQPRQPCFKLALRYGVPEMPVKVQETGYTGFYFRVLKEGKVERLDKLTRTQRHPHGISVSEANRLMHVDKNDPDAARAMLQVEELSESWRKTLMKRIAGSEADTTTRLEGI